jgi:hypothetical protein
MEENEYKEAYDEITQIVCVFEKALTNNLCKCGYAKHFWLADREGYACNSKPASEQCAAVLQQLRQNSRFSLKLQSVGAQLPHNMDIKVQAGGLTGLQKLYGATDVKYITGNIHELIDRAVSQAGSIENLPYSEIIKSIAGYQIRSRRKSKQ